MYRSAVLAFALLLPVPAFAAEDVPAAPRFAFVPAEGGALKMDSQSGKVSFCAKGPNGFTCEAVPDSRNAYEAEIERLQREIASLRAGATQGSAGTGTPGNPPGTNPPGANPRNPDFTELDQALDYVERIYRRLKEMVDGFNTPGQGEKL